jgi:hypothetical protein
MLHCIEITDDYHMGTAGRLWVFLDIASDMFLKTDCGRHVFNREEIEEHARVSELRRLIFGGERV